MSKLIALSLFSSLVALMGCNNNPLSTYRVQVDMSALSNLPASCYQQNQAPASKDLNPDERAEYIWTMWNGSTPTGTNFYLDPGTFNNMKLGDAIPVAMLGTIVSTDGKTFDGKDTQQDVLPFYPAPPATPPAGYSNTVVLEMNVAFTSTGSNPEGTANLTSQYQCTSCNNNDGQIAACGPISLPFSGVEIPAQPVTDYPVNAQ
jgi:hypothetical protein